MKTLKLNILAISTAVLLFAACKEDRIGRAMLPDGSVDFNLPATQEVVERDLEIKSVSVISIEMKAALAGAASSDLHYVTFATDTTQIATYRQKYGNSALLLPTRSYLFYKQTVAINAGTSLSEAAVLNLGFQTTLRPYSTYVLPITITAVDGKTLDPTTRRVVYYVFKTQDPLYVDHTGFTPFTATASSVNGANVANRVADGNNLGTYWLSNVTQTLPQWVNIDFKRQLNFSGLDLFHTTAINYATAGGDPTSAKVETSLDGISWVDRGTYTVNVRNNDRKHTITFPSQATGRYVRLTVLTANNYVAGTASYNVAFVGEILLRN